MTDRYSINRNAVGPWVDESVPVGDEDLNWFAMLFVVLVGLVVLPFFFALDWLEQKRGARRDRKEVEAVLGVMLNSDLIEDEDGAPWPHCHHCPAQVTRHGGQLTHVFRGYYTGQLIHVQVCLLPHSGKFGTRATWPRDVPAPPDA